MQTIYQAVSPLGCQQFIEYFRLIALLQIFFLQKFNLSGRICQGLAKLQSIFRNNIYTNDISCMFQSISSSISKRFQQYIAYLIRVGDFEKVELSYLNSIYHIRGYFPRESNNIPQTSCFSLFALALFMYISNFFVQRTSNNHCTIGKENFPPFPITPNIMLIFSLCCQKPWLKSSN